MRLRSGAGVELPCRRKAGMPVLDPFRPKLLANYTCDRLAQFAALCVALTLRWADDDR